MDKARALRPHREGRHEERPLRVKAQRYEHIFALAAYEEAQGRAHGNASAWNVDQRYFTSSTYVSCQQYPSQPTA